MLSSRPTDGSMDWRFISICVPTLVPRATAAARRARDSSTRQPQLSKKLGPPICFFLRNPNSVIYEPTSESRFGV